VKKKRALRGGAVMSFADIGKHLGITREGAGFLYRNALRKICDDHAALEQFQTLVEFRRREKDRRVA
jgi:hypothetical protein